MSPFGTSLFNSLWRKDIAVLMQPRIIVSALLRSTSDCLESDVQSSTSRLTHAFSAVYSLIHARRRGVALPLLILVLSFLDAPMRIRGRCDRYSRTRQPDRF